MLFITGTTLSVPSLMGAIMAVGVASANSILLVTFAREQQLAGRTAFEAAIDAGHTRIRPVLMTAAAMIVGMIPMAIGGAGEEQNAALGASGHRRSAVRYPDHPAGRPLFVCHACARETTANPLKAYSQDHSMNDLGNRTSRVGNDRSRADRRAGDQGLPERGGGAGAGACSRLSICLVPVRRSRSAPRATMPAISEVMATAEQKRDFVPQVRVADGRSRAIRSRRVTLPATTLAFEAANVYARASGYIAQTQRGHRRSRQEEGELLAEITAPELDAPDRTERGDPGPAQSSRSNKRKPTWSWRK